MRRGGPGGPPRTRVEPTLRVVLPGALAGLALAAVVVALLAALARRRGAAALAAAGRARCQRLREAVELLRELRQELTQLRRRRRLPEQLLDLLQDGGHLGRLQLERQQLLDQRLQLGDVDRLAPLQELRQL